jgi:GT2 family glycosyltransferase
MNEHLDGGQELVVVDNASGDSPQDAAAGWKGRHRFIALDRNAGFGAACNVGVAAASEPATVLLNPDAELVDAGLDRLAATATELGALVGPRVLNADGTVQPSASGPEVGPWPWVRALVPGVLQPGWLLARTEPYRLDRRTPVTWLTGACIAAPTATLRALGPFDEALRMYGEDVDLGLRAAAAGVGVWFDPSAGSVVHHGQGSSPLVYGTREGWRPVGALHWRAALRRAYGPRREWLAWRALRLNLRLRLLAKRLAGRATDRDRAALAAALAADPPPELPEVHSGVHRDRDFH